MSQEVIFNTRNKNKHNEYKLIKYISECLQKIEETKDKLTDYDYYCLIASDGDIYTLVCWNEGDEAENRAVYLAKRI